MSEETTSAFIPSTSVEVSKDFTDRTTISSGGFSLIVRAKRQGRWWILKGLKEEYRNQTAYQLLLRKEYDLMVSLSHPRVAMACSLENVDGMGLSIVMEWIDGKNLSAWLAEETPHSRKQRLRIANQIIEALSYIHSRQIVHRDLKPSNIMITANGEDVKLIDFGISDADSYTLFKQPAGTHGYVSPEQASGGKPDIRNDIYSLGRIMRDLRLGFAYRSVVSRCLKPIDKRYRNVEEVRTTLNRSRYIPYIILGIVAIFGLIVIGLANRHFDDTSVNPLIEKEPSEKIEKEPTTTEMNIPSAKEDTTKRHIHTAKIIVKKKTVDEGLKEEKWLNNNLVVFNPKDSTILSQQDCEVINTAIRSSLPKLKSSMKKYSKEINSISSYEEYKELKDKINKDMDAVINDCASQYADKEHTPMASGRINSLIKYRLKLYLYHFYFTPMFQDLVNKSSHNS